MNVTRESVKICENTWFDKHRDLFFTEEIPPKILCRPLSVSLRVGWHCNLTCKVCLSDSGPHRAFEPFSFAPLLKELSKMKPLRLVWTGGEPLLYNIRGDLSQSIALGNFNVVTTNLTMTNLPREIGQEIFWGVSLYGWDRQSCLSFTGRDIFRCVERNLHSLFNAGYSVGVSIRVDSKWPRYLPPMIEYISQFPVTKLLLLNTLLVGRLVPKIEPVTADMSKELETFIKMCKLPFPTVLPSIPSQYGDPREGYLLIEKKLGSKDIFFLNEIQCSCISELAQKILKNCCANFRLFTLQQYCMPCSTS